MDTIEKVKRRMIVKYPFFASIVENTKFIQDNSLQTAATDGTNIYYNANFLSTLNEDEQTFVIAHEVCHIAFNHISRSENKDNFLWNIATDSVINAFLIKDGLPGINGSINNPDAINYDAEEMYEKLLKNKNLNHNNNSIKGNNNQKNNKQDEQKQSNNNLQGNKQESNSNESNLKNNKDDKKSKDQSKNNSSNESDGKQNDEDNKQQKSNSLNTNFNSDNKNNDVGHDTHSMWKKTLENRKSNLSENDKNNQESKKEEKKYDKNNFLDKLNKLFKKKRKNKVNKNDNENKSSKKENDDLKGKDSQKEKNEEISKMGEKEAFRRNKIERKKQLDDLKEELSSTKSYSFDTSSGLRTIEDIGASTNLLDWRKILKEATKRDIDWTYANADIENGVLTPYLEEKSIPETEILLDTSGSISSLLLRGFLKECKNILQNSKLKVGCFDTNFYGFTEIRNDFDIENLPFYGGGGTDFDVAVSSFTRRVENKIIFTDGNGIVPSNCSNIIWIVFGNTKIYPKNCKVIYIDNEQLFKMFELKVKILSK